IATSGNYRNFRNVDGAICGHSISPSTGRPAENSTLSVTVVAPECITADALATACMVMNIDSAINMIERLDNVSAMFVTADENGQWQLRTTSRFPKLIH
ncbi:FAD:protein FMN transferase, partial [uncultured Muribaculum sp.]|uniref:FAD:protein FMN transferase n=1 Tax=uncultured Muribaculum sp. TaxID=1918613 RepID=UPI002676F392